MVVECFLRCLGTSPSNKMDVSECRLQKKAAVKVHRWAGEGCPAFSGLGALTWCPQAFTLLSCLEGYKVQALEVAKNV